MGTCKHSRENPASKTRAVDIALPVGSPQIQQSGLGQRDPVLSHRETPEEAHESTHPTQGFEDRIVPTLRRDGLLQRLFVDQFSVVGQIYRGAGERLERNN